MGQDSSKSQSSKQNALSVSTMGCYHDEDCMNLDPRLSTHTISNDNLVYSCPNAKCRGATEKSSGTCDCSSDCKLDPYSGKCCQHLEKVGADVFCVNDSMGKVDPKFVEVVKDSDTRFTEDTTVIPTLMTLPPMTLPPFRTTNVQQSTDIFSYLNSLVNI